MTAPKKVADRFLSAMAYRRGEFQNKIQSHLTGAIVEHYKATLARKNEQTRWVDHWETEVRQLIHKMLPRELIHEIRGFRDRQKAFREAVEEFKQGDARYRRYAENIVLKDYGLTRLKHKLDDQDTAAFWAQVEEAAALALDSV